MNQVIGTDVHPKFHKILWGMITGAVTWGLTFFPTELPEQIQAGLPLVVAGIVFYFIPEDFEVDIFTADEPGMEPDA